MVRPAMLACSVAVVMTVAAVPAAAEPDPPAPDVQPVAATAPEPVVDDGTVSSGDPATTKSPDGWTLTISARDETQRPIAPLTTAISTREYEVGGVFNGKVEGAGQSTPKGVFEVGYQIGCGIDMSTSNGVSITGTAGVNPSIQFLGIDTVDLPINGILPGIGTNLGGGLTVGLKPGLINVIPVTKKAYSGSAPWVSISGFRIKIDGCVGESFVRSYAILTKSTDSGDAILSW